MGRVTHLRVKVWKPLRLSSAVSKFKIANNFIAGDLDWGEVEIHRFGADFSPMSKIALRARTFSKKFPHHKRRTTNILTYDSLSYRMVQRRQKSSIVLPSIPSNEQ